MPLLPRALPDEVVGSVLARALYRSGLPPKRFLYSVFGVQKRGASFLMAGDANRIALLSGTTPKNIVLNHSMLPYSMAFMSSYRQQTLLAKAMTLNSTTECLSSLTKNASFGVPYKRRCDECVKADLQMHGESYWRRGHLLPGVFWCREHGFPLQEVDLPLKGHASTGLLCMPHKAHARENVVKQPRPIDWLISQLSHEALNGTIDPCRDWSSRYREQALELGYRLPSGNVASRLLTSIFLNTVGTELLDHLGYGQISVSSMRAWPMTMLRPGNADFSATKHVLMQAFLLARVPSPANVRSSYRSPGKVPRNYAQYDDELAANLTALIAKVARQQARVTVIWLLTELRARQVYKHHSNEMPQTQKVLAAFKASDQSERQIGLRPEWRERLKSRLKKQSPSHDNGASTEPRM